MCEALDQGDKVFDACENMRCFESMFTEQKTLRAEKPRKPGDPCVVVYFNSKVICPNFSETCACPKKDCRYRTYQKKYVEAKKKYEEEKAKLEQIKAQRVAAWDEVVGR